MIRNVEALEPPCTKGCEHPALVGDSRWKHPVKGAQAVGRDHQQAVAEVVYVANLATAHRVAGNLRFDERGHNGIALTISSTWALEVLIIPQHETRASGRGHPGRTAIGRQRVRLRSRKGYCG